MSVRRRPYFGNTPGLGDRLEAPPTAPANPAMRRPMPGGQASGPGMGMDPSMPPPPPSAVPGLIGESGGQMPAQTPGAAPPSGGPPPLGGDPSIIMQLLKQLGQL